MEADADLDKKEVRRPMNAFLIFCKRHRSMVRERNPHLDNRSVTRILGDLWANIEEEEKIQYTDLAKQYKDAFMKANPDYKWHNPERMTPAPVNKGPSRPTFPSVSTFITEDGPIVPGKLADPSNMGGLSLLMEGTQVKGNQFTVNKESDEQDIKPPSSTFIPNLQSPQIPQQSEGPGEKKSIYEQSNLSERKIETTETTDSIKQDYFKVKQETNAMDSCSSAHFSGTLEPKEDTPDDSIYSCGKFVMDHIIDKLYLSTIKNMSQSKLGGTPNIAQPQLLGAPVSTVIQPPQNEVIKPPPASLFLPPSQGKKSYHTSIAVRNLLEFTRKAAAQELPRTNEKVQLPIKTEVQKPIVSEAKQKLKDYCLKKENRQKIASGNGNPISIDFKEFKRKRCYSESCAELYRSQEKRMKLDSNQFEENGDKKLSLNDDNQPTRKSRRRNRGQRYQELINEGIIQPSKARMAAMRTDTNIKTISFKDTFFNRRMEDLGDEVLSVYPRQIRKRTMSESEKNRPSFDETSRYCTGDFDLEAHIKTLPACSLEKVVRPKRSVGKSLSESESGISVNITDNGGLKPESPEIPENKNVVTNAESNVPVVGSRKRKARKHSITHLLPVKNDQKSDVPSMLSGVIVEKVSKPKLQEKKENQDCVCDSVNDKNRKNDTSRESCSIQNKSVDEISVGNDSICDTKIDETSSPIELCSSKNKELEISGRNCSESNLNESIEKNKHSEDADLHKEAVEFTKLKDGLKECEDLQVNKTDLDNCATVYKENHDNMCSPSEQDSFLHDNEHGPIDMDLVLHENEHGPSNQDSDIHGQRDSENKMCATQDNNIDHSVDSGRHDEECASINNDVSANLQNDFDAQQMELCYLDKHSRDDQDENSNDTKCSTNIINSDSYDCDTKSEMITDNTLSDMENDVTMVTAVSVSIPLGTEESDDTENMTQLQINMSPVSQCDNNSVSMATIQTSLTCLG